MKRFYLTPNTILEILETGEIMDAVASGTGGTGENNGTGNIGMWDSPARKLYVK